MQDRYAGDIGDYGKFGLLRALSAAGLSIGVNWYMTFPSFSERSKNDGGYPIPQTFFDCDYALAETLYEISRPDNPERSVKALEDAGLIDGAAYFSDPVRVADRSEWHADAMSALRNCELVFLDPDNGLLADSVSPSAAKSVKYALYEEVGAYLADKKSADRKSVVIYNHRCRKKWDVYTQTIMAKLLSLPEVAEKPIRVITFPRFSVRDYFIVSATPEHDRRIQAALQSLENSEWRASGMCTKSISL